MPLLEIIIGMLVTGTATASLLLLLVSAVLLATGVSSLVWTKAVHVRQLEKEPLNWIEHAHPHVPSLRMIVTITLSGIVLFVVALQTVQGVFPFTDPYQGVNIWSLFLLGTAVGILSELQWKGAGAYAGAILAGTGVAFLLFMFLEPGHVFGQAIFLSLIIIGLPLACYATINQKKKARLLATAAAALLFWAGMYLL